MSRGHGAGSGDARGKAFAGAATFPKPPPPGGSGAGAGGSARAVEGAAVDGYRVVFLYKDPAEALVSRYSLAHCRHVQGDCEGEAAAQGAAAGAEEAGGRGAARGAAPSEAVAWPALGAYARAGVDRMRLRDHFAAYLHPAEPRGYPVVCLNYHKLWANLPAVVAALGLPPELARTFPARAESVRHGGSGSSGGNGVSGGDGGGDEGGELDETRAALRRMYAGIVAEIRANPAVLVI